jgi:hypothetical protein
MNIPARTADRLPKEREGGSVLAFVSPETSQFSAATNVLETWRISFSLLDDSDEIFFTMLIDVLYTHVASLLSNLF